MAIDRVHALTGHRIYAAILIACFIFPLISVGAFVVAVDPYFIFGSPGLRGINSARAFTDLAVAKPYIVRTRRPAAVALGSSRVEVGLDPHHPGWSEPDVFNFGLPGSNSYDVLLAFLHAQTVGRPLKQAVIGLDFFGFNIFFGSSGNTEREARFDDNNGLANFADFLDAELVRRGKPEIAKRQVAEPLPPDWNEAEYLTLNPIARLRVAFGTYPNGHSQYMRSGRDQGLAGGFPAVTPLMKLRARWPEMSKSIFRFQERYRMVYSRLALAESVLTVISQSKPVIFDDTGMRVWHGQAEVLRNVGGTGKLFNDMILSKSWVLWLPPPRLTYCFSHPDTGASTLDPFRFTLRRAYAANTDVRLFITPLQAAVRESFVALGLGGRYDFWLSELTRINEQEAAQAGRPAFPLWDFSDVNTITAEEMPAANDVTPMRWFWEYSHYRRETGDLILDRIFGRLNEASPLPADFGTALKGSTIGAHIEHSAARLADWRLRHADLSGRIRQAAASPDANTRQTQAPCW